MWNRNEHILTNIHRLKCTKGFIVQWYSYSNMGGKIIAVIHIYGARAMILLFCDCQITEPKQW